MIGFFLLFCIERNGKLERQVALLDSPLSNHFGILGENWLRDHGVLRLHKGEGCVFTIPVEVSIEMIMIFEEISEKQLGVIVCKFVLNLDEALLRVQDESLQSALEVLQVDEVFEG